MLVRRIESGAPCPTMTLAELENLATALGVEPATLLGRQADADQRASAPRADIARLGALLARARRLTPLAALTRGLGWERERVLDVAAALRVRLEPVGLTVHEFQSALQIRPLALDGLDLAAAVREQRACERLTRAEAELLRRIVQGDLDERAALSRAGKALLARLVEAGLVSWPASDPLERRRLRPAPELLYSLGIDAARNELADPARSTARLRRSAGARL